MTTRPVLCGSCERLRPGLECKAFPAGIPDDIAIFAADHRVEFPGDGGIRYLPDPKKAHILQEWKMVNDPNGG